MSDINYIDFLEQAASGRVDVSTIFELRRHWSDFEDDAKDEGYDAFSRACRSSMVRLLRLLQRHEFGGSVDTDVQQIREKDRDYGGSWQKRGGQGAFMMAARKWDRIEKQIDSRITSQGCEKLTISQIIAGDVRVEGIGDDIGDLRRYLILIEARWLALEENSKNQASQPPEIEPEIIF